MSTIGKMSVSQTESLFSQISTCLYCESIIRETACKTPIACTKLSGAARAIRVNVKTCLGCREYTKN